MRNNRKIYDLYSLEREIESRKMEAGAIEKQIGNNLSHLRENLIAFTMNSIFCSNGSKEKNPNIGHMFRNESLNAVTNKIVDSIRDVFERVWNKRKQ